MQVRVLGAAAGGGFPQWNSNAAGVPAGAGRRSARPAAHAGVNSGKCRWRTLVSVQCLARPAAADRGNAVPASARRSAFVADRRRGAHRGRCGCDRRAADAARAARLHDLCTAGHPPDTRGEPDLRGAGARCGRRDDAWRSARPIMLTLPDGRPSGLSVELLAVPGKVPLYLEATTERRRSSRAIRRSVQRVATGHAVCSSSRAART